MCIGHHYNEGEDNLQRSKNEVSCVNVLETQGFINDLRKISLLVERIFALSFVSISIRTIRECVRALFILTHCLTKSNQFILLLIFFIKNEYKNKYKYHGYKYEREHEIKYNT
jgi:hypothetical protein